MKRVQATPGQQPKEASGRFNHNVLESGLLQQVTHAVLSRDFKLAKSLATTKEHWRLIAVAEGEVTSPDATVSSEQPVLVQNTQDNICQDARGDYETTSRIYWRDKDLIATKKSMMFAACGVPEPVQNQPILVGVPYGVGWNRPYFNHNSLNHHQTYSFEHHHGAKNGGSLSLSYKSKRLGLQVNSFGQSSAY